MSYTFSSVKKCLLQRLGVYNTLLAPGDITCDQEITMGLRRDHHIEVLLRLRAQRRVGPAHLGKARRACQANTFGHCIERLRKTLFDTI